MNLIWYNGYVIYYFIYCDECEQVGHKALAASA